MGYIEFRELADELDISRLEVRGYVDVSLAGAQVEFVGVLGGVLALIFIFIHHLYYYIGTIIIVFSLGIGL